MGTVLTKADTVSCGHPPGKVDVSSSAKLTVNGNAVLLKSSIMGKSISGPCSTPQSNSTSPCKTVLSITGGEATKLTVGGQPVMLAESTTGTTDGLPATPPPGSLFAIAGQTKLTSQ